MSSQCCYFCQINAEFTAISQVKWSLDLHVMWWVEGRGVGLWLPRLADNHSPLSSSWLKWKGRGAVAACRVLCWAPGEDFHVDRPRANPTRTLEVNRSSPQDHRRAVMGCGQWRSVGSDGRKKVRDFGGSRKAAHRKRPASGTLTAVWGLRSLKREQIVPCWLVSVCVLSETPKIPSVLSLM